MMEGDCTRQETKAMKSIFDSLDEIKIEGLVFKDKIMGVIVEAVEGQVETLKDGSDEAVIRSAGTTINLASILVVVASDLLATLPSPLRETMTKRIADNMLERTEKVASSLRVAAEVLRQCSDNPLN